MPPPGTVTDAIKPMFSVVKPDGQGAITSSAGVFIYLVAKLRAADVSNGTVAQGSLKTSAG